MTVRMTGRAVFRVGDKVVESTALFDTGATKSFVDLALAEKAGFTRYDKPREVMLAVKGSKARAIGYIVARVEVEGCELPLEHVGWHGKMLTISTYGGSTRRNTEWRM